MSLFYLTPAAISFLTQFILALAISIILVVRRRHHPNVQLTYLVGFFSLATLFIGLMFLDAVLPPDKRLIFAVYAENTVLALALVFLIQFAYHFPKKYPQYKVEARLALIASLIYVALEAAFMIYRYWSLFGQEMVHYRPSNLVYMMGLIMILPPIAFLRQCAAADPRPVIWVRKIVQPEGKGARGARAFFGVFGLVFILGLINVLLLIGLPHVVYKAVMSLGVLIALWLFATNYINFISENVSVQVKLSVLTLTLFLALLGSVGWFLAPPYVEAFESNLQDNQTLRFIPDDHGSYQVVIAPFTFEDEIGDKLTIQHDHTVNSYQLVYTFPLFGEMYEDVNISNFGAVALGRPFWEPNMQVSGATFPAIIPLMVDLIPNLANDPASGVYARTDSDTGRLIVTWYRLAAYFQSDALYTFQLVLYPDGVFEFTYNGLPLPIQYSPDSSPRELPWMRGAVSGQGELLHVSGAGLLATAGIGETPLIENYNMAFRAHLHELMVPLAWMVISGSLLLMLVVPFLLRISIIRPLQILTRGVRRMEAGDLTVELPIQHDDEIGYLTGAFNKMAAGLGGFVHQLENMVAESTAGLTLANHRLEEQLAEIETLQAELREQAIRDPLTNAFNRRYLMETLAREIARADREEYRVSLVMLDVDHFKQFNDRYGHQAGDRALERLVELLMNSTRKSDVVCRYGGEEFVVLMPKTTAETACTRAEVWRAAYENLQFDQEGISDSPTISLGVTSCDDPEICAADLLNQADRAMYQAKAAGRNRTVFYRAPAVSARANPVD